MYNNPRDPVTSTLRHDAYPTLHIPNPPEQPPKRRRLVRGEPVSKHERDLAVELASIPPAEELPITEQDAPTTSTSRPEELSTISRDFDSPPLIVSHVKAAPPVSSTPPKQYACHGVQVNTEDPKVRRLRTENRRLLKTIATVRRRNLSLVSFCKLQKDRMKALVAHMDTMSCKRCDTQGRLPEHTQLFIEEQTGALRKKGRGMRWSESTIKMGQFLMYKSPSCYRRLQSFFHLPSVSTLQRKSAQVSSEPGICHNTLNAIQQLLSQVEPRDKAVVLTFDAMHIGMNLEFNRMADKVMGVEAISAEERRPGRAESLLVFMIRSITGGWSEIVGHHFTRSPFPREELKTTLMGYLSALHLATIRCKAVLCDQEPGHVSLFKSLGARKEAPYIRCPSSGEKIFIMYDPPHLLKSSRNNLINSEFVEPDGGISSWRDVAQLYELEKRLPLRMAPQLTEEHIHPTYGKKMKVSLAAQVFSRRTAAAMRSCVEDLPPTAPRTADLLEMFNDLFDFFNSNTVLECGTRRPALRHLWDRQKEDLRSYATRIAGLKFRNRRSSTLKATQPFKEGWLITIEAVMCLVDDLLEDEDVMFILTRRLNQDPLEHLFSAIRARGGFNDHPTVRQAAAALKAISATSFLKRTLSRNRNVEEEAEVYSDLQLARSPAPLGEEEGQQAEVEAEDETMEEEVIQGVDTSLDTSVLDSLQNKEALSYVLGSLIRRLGCTDCADSIGALKSKEEATSSFTRAMTYEGGHLYQPHDRMMVAFNSQLKPIMTWLKTNINILKITSTCVEVFRLSRDAVGCCSQEHSDELLKLFSRLLLRVLCRAENQKAKVSKSSSKKRKLNII